MQEQLKRQREETQRLKEAKEKAMLAFELETQEMNAEVIKRIEAAVEKAVEEEQAAAEERRQARELEVAKEKEELEAKLRDEFEEVKEVMADEYAVQVRTKAGAPSTFSCVIDCLQCLSMKPRWRMRDKSGPQERRRRSVCCKTASKNWKCRKRN